MPHFRPILPEVGIFDSKSQERSNQTMSSTMYPLPRSELTSRIEMFHFDFLAGAFSTLTAAGLLLPISTQTSFVCPFASVVAIVLCC